MHAAKWLEAGEPQTTLRLAGWRGVAALIALALLAAWAGRQAAVFLIVAAVIKMTLGEDANRTLSIVISLVALAGIVTAVYISKQRSTVIAEGDGDGTPAEPPAPPAAPVDDAPAEPEATQQFESAPPQ